MSAVKEVISSAVYGFLHGDRPTTRLGYINRECERRGLKQALFGISPLTEEHPFIQACLNAPDLRSLPTDRSLSFICAAIQFTSQIITDGQVNTKVRFKGTTMLGINPARYWKGRESTNLEKKILIEEVFPYFVENATSYGDFYTAIDVMTNFMRFYSYTKNSVPKNWPPKKDFNLAELGKILVNVKKNMPDLWKELIQIRSTSSMGGYNALLHLQGKFQASDDFCPNE